MRGVVQVASEDTPHIGSPDHLGQPRLAPQLQQRHQVDWGRNRRVVKCQQRAVNGRGVEFVREPVELLWSHVTVVITGHGAVERDDTEPTDVVHAVLRSRRGIRSGGFVIEISGETQPLVVIAHHPDHSGAHPVRSRLHDLTEATIRVVFAEVREITGKDDGCRIRLGALQLLQRPAQVAMGVDGPVERSWVAARIRSEEMRVAEVGDHMAGSSVLSELGHSPTLGRWSLSL